MNLRDKETTAGALELAENQSPMKEALWRENIPLLSSDTYKSGQEKPQG